MDGQGLGDDDSETADVSLGTGPMSCKNMSTPSKCKSLLGNKYTESGTGVGRLSSSMRFSTSAIANRSGPTSSGTDESRELVECPK